MSNSTNLKTWVVMVIFLLTLPVLSANAFATGTYDGGDGSAGDPFQINTPAQMDEIGQHSEDWASHFILTANIDLSAYTGTAFHIIGTDYDNPFTGAFDGNDHTISNFTYSSTGVSFIGLFGYVGSGEIKNLGLQSVNVDGGTGWNVGGLVGLNEYGTVSNCYASGTVTGGSEVGGLVGWNNSTVSNCYATSSVSGSSIVGGLLGYDYFSTVTASFWDIDTSGQATSAGGTGKTTVQMQTQSTFTDAGWDFVEIWGIGENQTYPYLRVYPAGDLNHDSRVDFLDFAIFANHWLPGVE